MGIANSGGSGGILPRRMWLSLCALLLLSATSGCAVGNKHAYTGITPDLLAQSDYTTAVAVQDRRPYVLDGDKDENFVGVQRGGFGNPFDVTTTSGKALASDICSTIVAALERRNIEAVPVEASPKATDAEVKKILISTSNDRLVLIQLVEWKADTYQNTALIYDIRLSVLDETGASIAESARQGRDDLGGSFMNPPAHAKEAVPTAYKRILEGLLNDPKVLAALQL